MKLLLQVYARLSKDIARETNSCATRQQLLGHQVGSQTVWHILPGNKALTGQHQLWEQGVQIPAGEMFSEGNVRHDVGPCPSPEGT